MSHWKMIAALFVLSASAALSLGACTALPEGDEARPEAASADEGATTEAAEAFWGPFQACRHGCSMEYDACMNIWGDLRRCTKRFVRCLDRCRGPIFLP